MRRLFLTLGILTASAGVVVGQTSGSAPAAVSLAADSAFSLADKEQFLRDARLISVRGARKGVTGTQKASLSDGSVNHDASIQSIDKSAQRYETATRVELNFRDYWAYNVAAYRLAVMLGIDMVPPSVERQFRGEKAAFTWWVDDVMMDEQERLKAKRRPPNTIDLNAHLHVLRVFDELIANTDRNGGNMLIDRRWKLWLIDHSRAFRTHDAPRAPAKLTLCERTMLSRMKDLTEASLKQALGDYLTMFEIRAVLKRRDHIVTRFESLGTVALYDLRVPPR